MPQINQIARDYRERGVSVLAMNYMESLSTVQTYQNMYPDLLMLRDTTGSAYSTYRQNGYIPLNYVIDHDMQQTIDYWMEGYNHSTILNRITNLLSDVTAKVQLDAPSFPRGTNLGFDVVVTNWIPANRTVYMMVDIELPSGGYFALGTTQLNLSASEVRIIPYDMTIPLTAPLGDFTVRARLGMPPMDLWNADYGDFEITP